MDEANGKSVLEAKSELMDFFSSLGWENLSAKEIVPLLIGMIGKPEEEVTARVKLVKKVVSGKKRNFSWEQSGAPDFYSRCLDSAPE